MKKRKTKERPQRSPRSELERTLSIGGAGGNYGFGRYPEGIFTTPRSMTFLRAKSDKSPAQLEREVDAAIYACPDGPACRQPECLRENARRVLARKPGKVG